MSTIKMAEAANPSNTTCVQLLSRYQRVRQFTELLCQPLATEDYIIQSMPDVSPTRWHLAHTTWFFETFVLKAFSPNYQSPYHQYDYLFNSYYNAVGQQYARANRGLLSRPTVDQIKQYRHSIDQLVCELINDALIADDIRFAQVLELGIQHEQQHQELMLTDIKHVFWCNPLLPAYSSGSSVDSSQQNFDISPLPDIANVKGSFGLVSVGDATDRFVFDNERPRHQVFLQPFRLNTMLVTNAQYLQFVDAGGYQRPELWLSLGWQAVQRENWRAPLYWYLVDDQWQHFTLSGARPLNLNQPVCHVSFFEADAYARWRGCRLPLETEWEVVAACQPLIGNFVESGWYQPMAAGPEPKLHQMFGDVWEWTASPYVPYPGYAPAAGALGEYNGKFMCNQYVLRGGSCVSSVSHLRATYRNFFPPETRWQFSGIRLAEDDA